MGKRQTCKHLQVANVLLCLYFGVGCISSSYDKNIGASLPDLRGLLAVPPEGEDIVPGLQGLRDLDEVLDGEGVGEVVVVGDAEGGPLGPRGSGALCRRHQGLLELGLGCNSIGILNF